MELHIGLVFYSLLGGKKKGLYLDPWSSFSILLLCRCWFLPLLPMYVNVCLNCLGFYAIVITWYVNIDCFASFPRNSATRQGNSHYYYFTCILMLWNKKAWQISTKTLHWRTAATTTSGGYRIPASPFFNLSSDKTKCIESTIKAEC